MISKPPAINEIKMTVIGNANSRSPVITSVKSSGGVDVSSDE